jgi:hypothetical protein
MSQSSRRAAHVRPIALVAAAVGGLVMLGAGEPDIRMSKFFEVDVGARRVKGPAPHVPGTLQLNLVSVTVDQPQYWPNEKVHLKVVMPGRPGAKFTAALKKRDANQADQKGALDGQGVAVLVVMDGEQKKLEVGEYRVDVRTDDGKASGVATFGVVEGTLGAVSLAYDFKQVTSAEELEKAKGAWFMGNAAGAGMRWGNGLNFKNELRVANQPYDGEVTCISRCMLPGCNGVAAGPPKTVRAVKGQVAGTMEVGGHSGPFQIEFVTPKGSLRHQFEGSSHVERDMVVASGGVSWNHRAGLSPYEKTVPVPGRQIFLEKQKGGDDPFEIDSIVARRGELTVRVAKGVLAPALVVWAPKGDGTFEPRAVSLEGELKPGQDVAVKVGAPYSLLTIGGFVGGTFKEGWAMAFTPAELKLDLDVPAAGAPASTVKVGVLARDASGAGAAVSGVLEVYDNRVASRSPMSPLASAMGDSVRSTSSSVSSWQDRTGIDPKKEAEERRKSERQSETGLEAPREVMAPSAAPPSQAPMKSIGAFATGGKGMGMAKMQLAGPRGAPGGRGAAQGEDEEKQELIREGERKVVFCGLVKTDGGGRASVDVVLPPQIGRVSVRFVAVKGLDHASAQKGLDVTLKASVEPQMPRTYVPGAQLQVPVAVFNTLPDAVTVTASGPGIKGRFTQAVKPGSSELTIPWAPAGSGKVVVELSDAKGKVLDRREVAVQGLGTQPVTFSRLIIGAGQRVNIAAGETAVVYPGSGALLKGIVMNLVTTMESWFGHAEALSAQVAARAVILSAISRKLIDDEGLAHSVKASLEKAVRDLAEAFVDGPSGLVRPYPGLSPNPLWSAWVSKNLHSAVNVLKADPQLLGTMAGTIVQAEKIAARIDAALKAQSFNIEEQGYDAQGRAVVPVEVDGKVVYRVLTDDAVTTWASAKLLPTLDWKRESAELAFSKAYDTFRFLRAFQRTGALQYLTEIATAYWLKGDKARFSDLFPQLARGMILAQEPGMVQGPAMLGGVYSSPMAMVRFLELLLHMADGRAATAGTVTVYGKGPREVKMGEPIAGEASIQAPDGAVIRVDRAGVVSLLATGAPSAPFGKVEVKPQQIGMGSEAVVTVTLDAKRDPLEYYALVAAPSTTAIKQTEDVLSDYRGQLIYGQQAMGGSKMQLVAVPFRGSRTLRLLLEGAFPGTSPGAVGIRHIENPAEYGALPMAEVSVAAK